MDPLDRAAEIFLKLNMQNTKDRNGVLLYIAMKDHELALFGDEGIHQKVGAEYWKNAVKKMIAQFANQHISLAKKESGDAYANSSDTQGNISLSAIGR